jgi:hypothetical protein
MGQQRGDPRRFRHSANLPYGVVQITLQACRWLRKLLADELSYIRKKPA